MKALAVALLLTLALALAGCGSGSNAGNINGNWSAALTNPDGTPAFAFTTTISQTGNNGVSFSNFNFTTSGSCFNSPVSETGSFVVSGNFQGNVQGSYQMTISTTFPSNNNVLTLQGTAHGNAISGTWTLTGMSGCSGSGNFTMTKM